MNQRGDWQGHTKERERPFKKGRLRSMYIWVEKGGDLSFVEFSQRVWYSDSHFTYIISLNHHDG